MNEKQRYREEVWVLMHGSGSSLQETAAVRLYLDESGGEDPSTPHAIVAGMLINYSRFHSFEDNWESLLEKHHIESPLHMKEFGRPHGRFAGVTNSCRFELFSEVSELINDYKIYSIAASVSNRQYQECVAKEIREKFSVYGLCFLLAVGMSHKMAQFNRHLGRIPFILDTGNPHKGHIAESHEEILKMQREGTFFNAGGLHFEDDRDFGILQAADVIAWGARRKATNVPLGKAFSPISRILDFDRAHGEKGWESDWMSEVSSNVMERYRKEQDENKK